MSYYKSYKPFSEEHNTDNLLNINKERIKAYKKSKTDFLKRTKPLNCLFSFLYRTLHDYLTSEKNLSPNQRFIINEWERAGLDKGSASKVLNRLYSLEDNLFDNLDKKYFSTSTKKLDAELRNDISQIDWKRYFSSKKVISPMRIQNAIKSKSLDGTTKKEKHFLNTLMKSHNKRSWERFVSNKETKQLVSSLVMERSGEYLLKYPNQLEPSYLHKDQLKALIEKLQNELQHPEPPPPPEWKLCSYEWSFSRVGHRMVVIDEKTGDDPVFIYSMLMNTGTQIVPLTDAEVYEPPEDQESLQPQSSVAKIYPKFGRHLSAAPERPIFVALAIENDQWFSEETTNYVDFGLRAANMVARADPTGVSSIVVGVVQLGWEILQFLDWLDDDDFVGATIWELPIERLSKPEEGEDFVDSYKWWPTFNFEGEGSHWQLHTQLEIHASTFIWE